MFLQLAVYDVVYNDKTKSRNQNPGLYREGQILLQTCMENTRYMEFEELL